MKDEAPGKLLEADGVYILREEISMKIGKEYILNAKTEAFIR